MTVSAQGSSYSGATTVTGGGGTGQTFTPTISGGHITSIAVSGTGTGYFQGNSLTITDSAGSGATATVNCAYIGQTVSNQELYQFSTLNTIVAQTSGIATVQGILSIALNQGTITPVLDHKPWVELQAYMRAYNTSYTSYPAVWSQYAYGINGSFYLWPVPSQIYGMDIDTYCLPISLAVDSDPEALPYPWTECVPYYVAYWALMNAQRSGDAKMMKDQYDEKILEARSFSQGPFIPSMYGDS